MKLDMELNDWTPHNLEMEGNVIGYYLKNGLERFSEAQASLSEDSFFSPNHQQLWRHLSDFAERKLQPDRASAENHLIVHRQFDAALAKSTVDIWANL